MSFLILAWIEVALLALTSGVVGTLIVLRKKAFFTVALSHATFPGGVIAALLGIHVLIGQAVLALLLALLLAVLGRARRQGQGAATGIVLVFGFALGSALTAMQTGFTVPVEQLLIGSIFGVQQSDILTAAIVLLLAITLLISHGRSLLYDTFDSVGFQAGGGSPLLAEIVTATLSAAVIIAAMPAVGAVLAVSLIVGPAVTASLIARNPAQMMLFACVFALAAGGLGLLASVWFSVAAGGAIGVAVALIFLSVFAAKNCRRFLPIKVK